MQRALLACPGTIPDPPSPPTPPPSQPGVPTTSTITELSGPTTIANGELLWKFQSVEGPSWDTARWGTNTHRFNVTIIPGSGPLPVYLMLHGAGDNGPREPDQFVNKVNPGIYVSPVDIAYVGINDPVTGRGRFHSKWMGYADASGIYQPVTADRVVRYVQWVLTQTSKWTPDPTRVYVEGGSMGGGGSMHIAAQYPNVFAAGISQIGWIDDDAWASGLGDCTPGMRWKTSNGPRCKEMLDEIYLVQHATGDLPQLFVTWNNDDSTISPARYPALIEAIEAARQGYMAEWRPGNHNAFQHRRLSRAPIHVERAVRRVCRRRRQSVDAERNPADRSVVEQPHRIAEPAHRDGVGDRHVANHGTTTAELPARRRHNSELDRR